MRAYRIHDFAGLEAFRREDCRVPSRGRARCSSGSGRRRSTIATCWSSRGRTAATCPCRWSRSPTARARWPRSAPGVTPGQARRPRGRRPSCRGWIDGPPTEAGGKRPWAARSTAMLAEDAVSARQEAWFRSPITCRIEEAATLPCAAVTAWHALIGRAALKPGDTVLVQGTGGVSLFALQFARLAGARVIATSSSDDKLERVRELGASDGINYKTTPEWDKAVPRADRRRGVDHVVEVGGAGTLGQVAPRRADGGPRSPDRRPQRRRRGQSVRRS